MYSERPLLHLLHTDGQHIKDKTNISTLVKFSANPSQQNSFSEP